MTRCGHKRRMSASNPMEPHVTREQIEAFRRGELPKEQLVSLSDHLRACDDCGAAASSYTPAAAALAGELSAGEHPELDELFAFAAGELGEPRAGEIAAHLYECARCSEDVEDAKSIEATIEHRSWWPRAAAAAVAIAVIGGGVFWLTERQHPSPQPVTIRTVRVQPDPWSAFAAEARKAGAIAMPAVVRELRAGGESVRGRTRSQTELDPRPAGTVITTTRPQLTWHAEPGEQYIVSIVCNDTLAARSDPTDSGRWTPPHPLPRGTTCAWQLKRVRDNAILPTTTAPQPMFRILDAPTATRIASAPDDFTKGVLYARAGAQEEAVEHLRKWTTAHPTDEEARRILESVQGW